MMVVFVLLIVTLLSSPSTGFRLGYKEGQLSAFEQLEEDLYQPQPEVELEVLVDQIFEEIQEQALNSPPDHTRVVHVADEDMNELIEEIYKYPSRSPVSNSDEEEGVVVSSHEDLELINALNSLESILNMNQESLKRRRRSVAQDQMLMDAVETIESMLPSSNRTGRSAHANHDVTEPEDSDNLLSAIGSLESLMRTTSNSSRRRRSLDESTGGILQEKVLQVYHTVNKAEMKVSHDSSAALNLLEKAKTNLKVIAKILTNREYDDKNIVKKVVKRRSVEQGPIEALTRKMVTRGYNSQEYYWLSREFDLTKEDVDEVKNLSEEEFLQFSRSLKEANVPSSDRQYSVDDLLEVFTAARQIVPAELEAAAQGVVHVGRHLGDRARLVT